jgi:hypothetical protein
LIFSLEIKVVEAKLNYIRASPAMLSICDPPHENWMKKTQHMLVWLMKIVLAGERLELGRKECNKNMI